MASEYQYTYWLEVYQQIGKIALKEKMEQFLKYKWGENLHSLAFDSGITGHFFVDNDVFHFEICQNRIELSVIAHSRQKADELYDKFVTAFNLLFE